MQFGEKTWLLYNIVYFLNMYSVKTQLLYNLQKYLKIQYLLAKWEPGKWNVYFKV